MLVEIKRLSIHNDGYRRHVTLERMYINSTSIVSISDYHGARNFLLRENSKFSKDNFSLVRINQGDKVEEIIAFGTAEQLYSSMGKVISGKRLLND
jgi:hypothetical protein